MASAALERDLASILPRESIVLEETAAYLRDETEGRGFHGRADAVVLPGSTDEVERVLAWCYEHQVPLIPAAAAPALPAAQSRSTAASL